MFPICFTKKTTRLFLLAITTLVSLAVLSAVSPQAQARSQWESSKEYVQMNNYLSFLKDNRNTVSSNSTKNSYRETLNSRTNNASKKAKALYKEDYKKSKRMSDRNAISQKKTAQNNYIKSIKKNKENLKSSIKKIERSGLKKLKNSLGKIEEENSSKLRYLRNRLSQLKKKYSESTPAGKLKLRKPIIDTTNKINAVKDNILKLNKEVGAKIDKEVQNSISSAKRSSKKKAASIKRNYKKRLKWVDKNRVLILRDTRSKLSYTYHKRVDRTDSVNKKGMLYIKSMPSSKPTPEPEPNPEPEPPVETTLNSYPTSDDLNVPVEFSSNRTVSFYQCYIKVTRTEDAETIMVFFSGWFTCSSPYSLGTDDYDAGTSIEFGVRAVEEISGDNYFEETPATFTLIKP